MRKQCTTQSFITHTPFLACDVARRLFPGSPVGGSPPRSFASLRSDGPEIRPGVGARLGNVKEHTLSCDFIGPVPCDVSPVTNRLVTQVGR
eukprot:844135-Prorocentrum_minimum.AAC.1